MQTREEFEAYCRGFIEEMERKLIVKNKEYAGDKPPLHNFHKSADILRVNPKETALAFATKHITSIIDMCKDRDGAFSEELWMEKLSDLAVYCALIYCLSQEENRWVE